MFEPTEGHNLLIDKIPFSYMYTNKGKHEEKNKNIEMKREKKRKYNIESLHDETTKFLYQHRLNDKLKQNEFADTEEM